MMTGSDSTIVLNEFSYFLAIFFTKRYVKLLYKTSYTHAYSIFKAIF